MGEWLGKPGHSASVANARLTSQLLTEAAAPFTSPPRVYRSDMRDPHVERLHFEIGAEEGNAYENPERLTFTNPLGQFDAQDGNLVVQPADHYADEDSARAVIEPFLRDWEIETDLDLNIGTIRFKFLRAEVIDRNPPKPGESRVISVKAGAMAFASAHASLMLIRKRYPVPSGSFQANADARRAHQRWKDFRAGREPLQGMAYYVLTILEKAAGSRKNAAMLFAVDFAILDKIGDLTSTKGDERTARKAPRSGTYQELTGQEKAWLEQAVRRLIKRLGEHASGRSQITMADLPKL
jgi:hypothetical protein